MFYIGDFVRHNTFPPVEGFVSVIENARVGPNKIAVQCSNERLFWDSEDTWDLVESKDNDENIIDVDFKVIEEDN